VANDIIIVCVVIMHFHRLVVCIVYAYCWLCEDIVYRMCCLYVCVVVVERCLCFGIVVFGVVISVFDL